MKKTTTTKQNKYSLNKPVYLGVQILEINKILMYKFWYDYAKAKYGEKMLCYMDIDSFIEQIKIEDIYSDIARC